MNVLKSVIAVVLCFGLSGASWIPVAAEEQVPYLPVFGSLERSGVSRILQQNTCEEGQAEISPFYPVYPDREFDPTQRQNAVFVPLMINGEYVSGDQCLPEENLLESIVLFMIDQQGNRQAIAPMIQSGESGVYFVDGMETTEVTTYPLTMTLSYTDVLVLTTTPAPENVTRLGLLAVLPHTGPLDELPAPPHLLQPPEGPVNWDALRVDNTMSYMQEQLLETDTVYEPKLRVSDPIYLAPSHNAGFTTGAFECDPAYLAQEGGRLPIRITGFALYPDVRTGGVSQTWWAYIYLTQEGAARCGAFDLRYHWIPGVDAFNRLPEVDKLSISMAVEQRGRIWPFSMPMVPNPGYSPVPPGPVDEEVVVTMYKVGIVVLVIVVIVGVTIVAPEAWIFVFIAL